MNARTQRRLERYADAVALVDAEIARPRVVEAVGYLRQGMKGIEIAEAMGIGRSQAFDLLNDPTSERARERKRKRHGSCKDCGIPTYNGGSYDLPERCRECRKAHETALARERIIAAIKDWNARYGRPPGAAEWNTAPANLAKMHPERRAGVLARHKERRWPPMSSVQATFGSWSAAIEAAGLTPTPQGQRIDPEAWKRHRRSLDPDQMLDVLRAAAVDGVAPSFNRWQDEGRSPSTYSYVRYFGSWTNAVKQAGLRPAKRGRRNMGSAITAEEIIERELTKNEQRCAELQEKLDALLSEQSKLKAAQAAMNGASA